MDRRNRAGWTGASENPGPEVFSLSRKRISSDNVRVRSRSRLAKLTAACSRAIRTAVGAVRAGGSRRQEVSARDLPNLSGIWPAENVRWAKAFGKAPAFVFGRVRGPMTVRKGRTQIEASACAAFRRAFRTPEWTLQAEFTAVRATCFVKGSRHRRGGDGLADSSGRRPSNGRHLLRARAVGAARSATTLKRCQ